MGDMGGGRGQKSQKSAWRTLWTAPYYFVQAVKKVSPLHRKFKPSYKFFQVIENFLPFFN